MNFVSYKQFIEDTIQFSKQLPEFDIVIGIARSGILPAYIISLNKNIGFGIYNDNKIYEIKAGRNKRLIDNNILLVDDSVLSGYTIESAKSVIPGCKTACVYSQFENQVNYFYKTIKYPRIFEWNLFHRADTAQMAFDLDDVLCNETEYLNNPNDVKADIIPTYTIGCIVTGRLEQGRKETVDWLNKNGIKYNKLIMRQDRSYDIATLKGNFYKNTEYVLFIESDPVQSKKIAEISNKPVLSFMEMKMING